METGKKTKTSQKNRCKMMRPYIFCISSAEKLRQETTADRVYENETSGARIGVNIVEMARYVVEPSGPFCNISGNISEIEGPLMFIRRNVIPLACLFKEPSGDFITNAHWPMICCVAADHLRNNDSIGYPLTLHAILEWHVPVERVVTQLGLINYRKKRVYVTPREMARERAFDETPPLQPRKQQQQQQHQRQQSTKSCDLDYTTVMEHCPMHSMALTPSTIMGGIAKTAEELRECMTDLMAGAKECVLGKNRGSCMMLLRIEAEWREVPNYPEIGGDCSDITESDTEEEEEEEEAKI